MKIIEKIYDVSTGEETILERNASREEISELEQMQAQAAEQMAKAQKVKAERAVLLTKLGITEEEVKLLLA